VGEREGDFVAEINVRNVPFLFSIPKIDVPFKNLKNGRFAFGAHPGKYTAKFQQVWISGNIRNEYWIRISQAFQEFSTHNPPLFIKKVSREKFFLEFESELPFKI